MQIGPEVNWIWPALAFAGVVYFYIQARIQRRRADNLTSVAEQAQQNAREALTLAGDTASARVVAETHLESIRVAMGLDDDTPYDRLALEVRGYVQGADVEARRADELQEENRVLREGVHPDEAEMARVRAANLGLRQRNSRFQDEIRRLNGELRRFQQVSVHTEGQSYSLELDADETMNLLSNISAAIESSASRGGLRYDDLNEAIAAARQGTERRQEEARVESPDRMSLLMEDDDEELGTTSD